VQQKAQNQLNVNVPDKPGRRDIVCVCARVCVCVRERESTASPSADFAPLKGKLIWPERGT